MSWKLLAGCVMTAVFGVLQPAPALGQAAGRIDGVVTDGTGGVLPGVTIEATHEATGTLRAAATGADGFYTIPLLVPGRYTVAASLPGFRSLVREDVLVSVNQTVRVDLQMPVGAQQESITVAGEVPLIETSHATMGIAIDERLIVGLPLNGRNFTQLGTLIPGVVAPPGPLGGQSGDATPGGFGNVTGGFNVNGMRNQSNNFLLDGMTNNDSFNTGFVLRPPPDAIQEFKIQTHSYTVEYGRNAGSIVDVVTRSGGSRWSGTAWEFHRNDRLEARTFFASRAEDKPRLDQHQFGFSLGGPVVREKLFGFGYYEGFRNTRGQTDTVVVLTEAERRGDFSATGRAILDPLTGQPFPDNRIPAARLHPASARLLDALVPLPNTGANRYTQSPDRTDDRNQFGLRFDARLNGRHSLLGRYLRSGTRAFNPLGPSHFSPEGSASEAALQDAMFSHTYVLNPNAINVARVNANRLRALPATTSGVTNAEFGLGIPNTQPTGVGLANINVIGFFNLGDANQPFARRENDAFQFRNDFTYVAGRHAWKAGVDVRRERIFLASLNRPNGNAIFDGSYTGSATGDFLLGFMRQFRQGGGDPEKDSHSWGYAAYVQDEIRLLPNLTLNLGLRYELTLPYVEKHDRVNTFRPGRQSEVRPDAPPGLLYPGDEGVPRGIIRTDRNNVAPRVSAAWDPRGDGGISVRGGWGIFYDLVPGQADVFQNILAPPFNPLTQIDYPDGLAAPNFHDPFDGREPVFQGFDASTLFIGWGGLFHATPYAHHFNLSVQRQLGRNYGLEVGYVGSRGRNLPIFMEENPGRVEPGQVQRGERRYPDYNLLRPSFNVARSWYDALQASIRKRPGRGTTFLASYTWSHAIDHNSGVNLAGAIERRPPVPVDQRDPSSFEAALASVKGSAMFDVRHRFVASFGIELPAPAGASGVLRAILDGWQLNGIVQGQTGFAFTPIETTDVALGFLENRPDMICDPNRNAPRTVEAWFDTACFQRLRLPQDAGRAGNAGRGTIRGPGFWNTDLSVVRNVGVRTGHRLELRVEVFNVFNQPRFGVPGTIVGSPLFGAITTAEDGRIVQLGVKYLF